MVVVALRMCLQYGRSFSLWRSSCPITTDVTTLICSGLSSVYPKKRAAAVAASLICSPIKRNIGRFFGRPDRAIQRTGYRITNPPQAAPTSILCTEPFVCKPVSKVANAVASPSDWRPAHCASNSKPPEVANFSVSHIQHYRTVGRWSM